MSSKDFLKSLVLGQLGNGLFFGAWAFSDFPLSFYKKKGRWELEILQCQGYTYSSVIATHKCPRMIFRTPLCRLEYT